MSNKYWICFFTPGILLYGFCNAQISVLEKPLDIENLNFENYFSQNPIDDPFYYDTLGLECFKNVELSAPMFVIPQIHIDGINYQNSNNNVNISIFNSKLYLAFRSSKTHFAGKSTKVYVVSTKNLKDWKKEFEIGIDSDIREPHFLKLDNKLALIYFEGGTNIAAFEPQKLKSFSTNGNEKWTEDTIRLGEDKDVHWSIKRRNNIYYATLYSGSHYKLRGESNLLLRFNYSPDGINWKGIGDSFGVVYKGGVSETDFEFDTDGNLWAITRNEDGDKTGFGSHLAFANSDQLYKWEFTEKSFPHAYMSPKLFRYCDHIFLIARKNLGENEFGFTSNKRSMTFQRLNNWINFSLSPKTTALYIIDKEKRTIRHLTDLPGYGDTAFPSILRLDANTFLIANYTSPLNKPNRTWLGGQLGKTSIYLQVLRFVP